MLFKDPGTRKSAQSPERSSPPTYELIRVALPKTNPTKIVSGVLPVVVLNHADHRYRGSRGKGVHDEAEDLGYPVPILIGEGTNPDYDVHRFPLT
jgi:hypothetical protein